MILRRSLLASVAAITMIGFGTSALAEDPTKIGFIYVGPTGDFGWTYQHDQGRQAIEAHFGDKVETTYVESVPEGADAERIIRQMAQGGTDLIFTTSFGYMDATLKVAADFPDVKFEHATGFKRADNVSTYSSRFYEGRAIIGTIAGRMTQSNKVGYIASFPIPEVVRGINAAYLAAKKVNPDVEFKVVWVSSWFDPAKEGDAANALIDQGVDIIMQHTDSAAAMTIAQEKGVLAFGQASDMAQFGPDAQMTGIIDNWNDYYIARTQAIMDGTWASTETWGGFDADMVHMAPYNESTIPAEVIEEVKAMQAAITAGELHAFTGPINKQDGSAWLAEGETADDGTLLGMDFYVEGITGELPN